VIVICGNDEDEVKRRLKNQKGWEELTAIKKDRILIIPCDLICRPSPRIAETIEKVARGLHPEIFPPSPFLRESSVRPAISPELRR